MRILVVVAGVTLGLSGCIGGGVVYRTPVGNETADTGDEADGERAPWQLDDGTDADAGSLDGKGSSDDKTGKDGSSKKEGNDTDPGGGDGDPKDPDQNETGGSGGEEGDDPLQDLQDQAPTEGAADTGSIQQGAEEGADATVEGATGIVDKGTSSTPKNPFPAPNVEDSVDNLNTPDTDKVIPTTESLLFSAD